VPLVLLISFSAPGRKFLDFDTEGLAPNAWLVGLLGSAIVGIAVAPRVLVPYRHMEYLIVPFAILAGVGFFRLLDLRAVRGPMRTAALGAVGLVCVTNAFTGVPPAVPMPADVVAKFDGSSFIKVFDNGYAQLYWVVWGCATAC